VRFNCKNQRKQMFQLKMCRIDTSFSLHFQTPFFLAFSERTWTEINWQVSSADEVSISVVFSGVLKTQNLPPMGEIHFCILNAKSWHNA
jgi:hypothetical protein